jgi:putative tricarboxylic transport membrane protein
MVIKKINKNLFMLALVAGLIILIFGIQGQAIGESIPKPEGYPSRNIEYVVPWGAGGGSDIFGRVVCMPARREMGVSIVVVNMPGGAGAVGTEYVMKQPADGYTLFGITNDLDVNYLLGRSAYTPHKDLTPIIRAHVDVSSIMVGKNSPAQNWQGLVDYAKKNPGKLTMGGIGALASDERWGQMVWEAAGVKVSYVPFDDAGEMHAALLGGHIDTMFEEPGVVISMVEQGLLKPVIILTEKRLAKFPDVPSAGEIGVVPPMMWRGIAVKRGTPPEIVSYLEKVFTKSLESDLYKSFEKSRLLDLYPGYLGSADFMKVWEKEFELNEKALKKQGLIK